MLGLDVTTGELSVNLEGYLGLEGRALQLAERAFKVERAQPRRCPSTSGLG